MQESNENQPATCRATTSKGNQCKGFACQGSEYCFTHSPAHAEARAEARRRGGENHAPTYSSPPFPKVDTLTARGLADTIDRLIRDTWELPPSLNRARTIAYLITIQQDLIPEAEIEASYSEDKAWYKAHGLKS
jgi:hypothetical protein